MVACEKFYRNFKIAVSVHASDNNNNNNSHDNVYGAVI